MKNGVKLPLAVIAVVFLHRNIVNVDECFIDVAAIVLSIDDIEHGKLDEIDAADF